MTWCIFYILKLTSAYGKATRDEITLKHHVIFSLPPPLLLWLSVYVNDTKPSLVAAWLY